MNHKFEDNDKFFDQEFKEHVARVTKVGDGVTIVNWQKPGTGIFRIVYLLWHKVLFVTGDVGSAVYRWSDHLSLEFLAGLNIDYFRSKCEASGTGIGGREWFEEKAAEEAEQVVVLDHGGSAEDYREAMTHTESQEAWCEFLSSDLGEKFFGSDALEFSEAGMAPSIEVQFHLAGLKRAWAQIEAEGAKVQA